MKSKLPAPTAKDINDAHRLARSTAEKAVERAMECGRMLAAKKQALAHGEFMPWVEKHCDFAYSTAARYMKAAQSSTAVEISSLSRLFPSGRAKTKPKDSPKGAVSVVKPTADGPRGTEETGNDRPAAPISTAKEAQPKPIEVTPAPVFDFTDYEPEDDDAYKANIENVMMADDKLTAMREELKQCHREIQALKASRDHYQSEAGAAVRLVKARDREIERLKKQIKALEDRRAA